MRGRIGKCGRRRRRVYSLEPKKTLEATFVKNYVNHLMPSLLKIVNEEKRSSVEDCCSSEVYNKVKYEVDMALVMSTNGLFTWSQALKNNLEDNVSRVGNSRVLNEKMKKEDVNGRLMNLRSILPGGDGMSDDKLLGEIGSYIVCLELQVNALKSLTDF